MFLKVADLEIMEKKIHSTLSCGHKLEYPFYFVSEEIDDTDELTGDDIKGQLYLSVCKECYEANKDIYKLEEIIY